VSCANEKISFEKQTTTLLSPSEHNRATIIPSPMTEIAIKFKNLTRYRLKLNFKMVDIP
jgi:hypothetical protein